MKLINYPVGSTFGLNDIPDSVTAVGFEVENHENVSEKTDGYVFRRELLREILNYLRAPNGDAFFLSGPTGSGKTSGVTETLARLNWPCQEITANGRFEFQQLVGQFKLVSRNPGDPPHMEYVYGMLPIAMKYGHVLLINEIDLIDPAEISGLNDIIEGSPLVIPENAGEVIHPHPMFRIIATGNSNGAGDNSGLYRGVMAQNIAFMDRFLISNVGYIGPEAEEEILSKSVKKMPKKLRTKLVEVANAIRKQFLGESGTGLDGQLAVTMSTRTLVRWAILAMDFRQHPTPLQYAMDLSLTNRAAPEEAEAIRQIASGILGDQWLGTQPKGG
jgi:cobaltochelatase CobS